MRVRLSLATGLIASLALLGACQKEPTAEAYAGADAPPASVQTTEVAPLAGAPSEQTQAAATQSADDAYIASLESRGLMAERRYDPATGRTTLVVFNRPIANPVLRGGPRTRYAANTRTARVRGSMSSGVYASTARSASSSAAASSAVAANTAAAPAVTAAPSASAAAPAESAAPATVATTGPGVQAIPQASEPAVQVTDPARAGFEMTPTMWGIVGLIILALLIALFVANRPKARRQAYSAHQAPPEASGGAHDAHDSHGEAHA